MAKDISVDVVSEDAEYESYEAEVKKALEGAFKFLDKQGFVEVGLVTGDRMEELNSEYRGKDEPTNVLSFGEPEDFSNPEHPGSLGEIYLAPDVINKRKEDIVRLAVHGFLHLVGYTHDSKSDTIDMERKEDEILDYLSSL